MNIIISNNSAKLIYEQVKEGIKQAIFSHELCEGEILPSVRSMANELKISFLTVKKAYDELETEGFIETIQGKGSFVLPQNLEMIKEEKLCQIQKHMEEIAHIAQVSNITKEEIQELWKIVFKEVL